MTETVSAGVVETADSDAVAPAANGWDPRVLS
jgi:hypothetical protein